MGVQRDGNTVTESLLMALTLTKKKNAVVTGLDIESGSVAATEAHLNGSVAVSKTAVVPLEPGLVRDGEILDPAGLGTALKNLFEVHKLSKAVRFGVANQRVAVRTLRMPLIEKKAERDTAVRFQAQDHIPMPLDQAVLDYQVVGHAEGAGGARQMDVIIVAARRDMIAKYLETASLAGLRPIGIDLSAFGMIRALWPELAASANSAEAATAAGARLYCGLGSVTNLAVGRGGDCLFTRISTYGTEAIAQSLAERAGLTLEHARQWIMHVGLERPLGQLEGDPDKIAATRQVLTEGVAKLADELRLSLEFYGAQEGAVAIEGIVASGPGSAVPGLTDRLRDELGHHFEVRRPKALMHLEDPAAARLTLSLGLAVDR